MEQLTEQKLELSSHKTFSKGTKVAKKSTLVVTIATLKVPNFADYTIESAGEIEGITASVKKQFSESAPMVA